jgi:hypothetical protein
VGTKIYFRISNLLIQQAHEAYSNPSLSARINRYASSLGFPWLWGRATAERDNARGVSHSDRATCRFLVAVRFESPVDLTSGGRPRRGEARSAE